jgi:hypothetical protein
MNHHEEREEHEGKDGMKRYVLCSPFVSLVLFVVRKISTIHPLNYSN